MPRTTKRSSSREKRKTLRLKPWPAPCAKVTVSTGASRPSHRSFTPSVMPGDAGWNRFFKSVVTEASRATGGAPHVSGRSGSGSGAGTGGTSPQGDGGGGGGSECGGALAEAGTAATATSTGARGDDAPPHPSSIINARIRARAIANHRQPIGAHGAWRARFGRAAVRGQAG